VPCISAAPPDVIPQVYFEPQDGGSVESVLSEYTDSIRNKVGYLLRVMVDH
jgi:hypothetical protein